MVYTNLVEENHLEHKISSVVEIFMDNEFAIYFHEGLTLSGTFSMSMIGPYFFQQGDVTSISVGNFDGFKTPYENLENEPPEDLRRALIE